MSDESNHPRAGQGRILALALAALVAFTGCSTFQSRQPPSESAPEPQPIYSETKGEDLAPAESTPAPDDAELGPELYPGSGEFINRRAASRPVPGEAPEGDITLNFEGQDLVEVARIILGDIMQENYVIGPGVSGQVSFSTARPIKRDQLMPILEMLLRWNNATIVWAEGRYNILPIDQAIPGNLTPRVGPADAVRGFEVRAVPLEYISPTEMQKLLEPFARAGAVVSADNTRNLLILAGTSQELGNYMNTIEVFDVNWLDGMSVGIFPLERVEVDTVVTELESVFGENAGTPLAGMFRFMPMERLNAILVITPQPRYLEEARSWVERLDRAGDAGSGTRLYVYYVQNVKAVDLADYLSDIFSGSSSSSSNRSRQTGGAGGLAPGLRATEISSINSPSQRRQEAREEREEQRNAAAQAAQQGRDQGVAITESDDIRITAVEESNALLIRATAGQYDAILGAIKRLDVVPLQVLIDVKLIEVTLTGQLNYGVEWLFESAINSGDDGSGGGSKNIFGSTVSRGGSVGAGGFNYSITGVDAQAIVSAIASEGETNVISAPTLVVLNNKEASINVGDQIPVVSTIVNTNNTNIGTSSNVQFRDTGVILNVVPRVNPGGLVFMEIDQELSIPAADTPDPTGTGNVPVSRRSITTEVAVQSGETLVLGGLIRQNQTGGNAGVPGLRKIPLIGGLFSRTTGSNDRTELIVLITPRVIANAEEARQITNEYRDRFRGLQPLLEKADRGEAPTNDEEFEW